jgi:peptidoglycan/LPS O-acetylase OafA/YrhL
VNSTSLRSGFLPELNGLRAIAITLVFFAHACLFIPEINPVAKIVRAYMSIGWIGVDLFFVVSGFLITGILLDTKTAENYFSGFYARRVLRIFPLYYAVLTFVLLGAALLQNEGASAVLPLPADRWVYYCYLSNWVALWKGSWGPNYLGHFWSLAVEEQFYFVWPLLVWLLPTRWVPRLAAALAAVAVVTRLVWLAHTGPQVEIALATICRMDSLFIGAICASVFRNADLMQRLNKLLPLGASLGIGGFLLGFSAMVFFPAQADKLLYGSSGGASLEDSTLLFSEAGGLTLLACGFGALVLWAARGGNSVFHRVLCAAPLNRVGTYSYGIYVFHVPVLGATLLFVVPQFIHDEGPHPLYGLAFFAYVATVTYLLSAISYGWLERPILALKRHFEPKYPAIAKPAVLEVLQPEQKAMAADPNQS